MKKVLDYIADQAITIQGLRSEIAKVQNDAIDLRQKNGDLLDTVNAVIGHIASEPEAVNAAPGLLVSDCVAAVLGRYRNEVAELKVVRDDAIRQLQEFIGDDDNFDDDGTDPDEPAILPFVLAADLVEPSGLEVRQSE